MIKQKEEINNEIILFKKVWTVDKYNFFEYISVMLNWWVWINEALSSVGSKIKSPYFRQKIYEIIAFISSWDSFSKSMKKMPDVFSMSEISIIEAWEETWKLVESLRKLSNDLKKIHNLKNKIKSALTYPFIIFIFLIMGVTIVMAYVIPSMKSLFEDSGTDLPIITQTLINSSDIIYNNFSLILFIIFIIFVVVFIYINTESWKIKTEKLILSTPLIWRVYRNYLLANSAGTLWNLVWSWISVIKALQLAWKSSWSLVFQHIFEEVAEKVSSWEKIVSAIEEIDKDNIFFTLDYLQMLAVWEKTASIEEVSKKLTEQYEKEVEYSLENMVKWIEPLALVLAWIFVLWFVFAIFWAIIQITQSV